ncbi:hypothetical protein [Dongia sedimenti]|uniref:RcnB family protein n=1 Tax=Dongia sedimenti TaxID=3064282 RepID=A0ABU0YW91_9PROT|nr:hypothetical protein [Rhodospirillaceae bacterium R-7]
MRLLLQISVGLLIGLSGIAQCAAQSEPGAAQTGGPSVGDIIIDAAARRILRDYFARNADAWVAANPDQASGNNKRKNKHKNLPPGIAKKGSLPPGLAKQLVRNGHLPPGLEYRDLPPDLIVQLPPLAPDYRYVIADDRVMLIRAATNVILDILQVPAL